MGLIDDARETLRNPSDEQKAVGFAFVGILVGNVIAFLWGFPPMVATTTAVGIGFIALFVASYALTGHLVPPDEEEPEEYEPEL